MNRLRLLPLGILLASGVVAILLSGTGAANSNTNSAGNPGSVSKRPTVPLAGDGHFIGKPRPPVDVILGSDVPLESGVPARLVLTVRAAPGIEITELNLDGGPGLTVVQTRRMDTAAIALNDEVSRQVGQAIRFEVSATPMAGGAQYLAGLVRFRVGDVWQAVPFRISLQVGGPAGPTRTGSAKPEAAPVLDAVGELIVSMPAETTIR